jgi:hypothetical protein
MHRALKLRPIVIAALSTILACSSAPESPPSTGSGTRADQNATPVNAASKDTGIAGEQFAPLDVGQDKLSGVFVKDGTSLAFEVRRAPGASVFRLSTASGEVLYSQVQGPSGFEMRVGPSFRSVLPLAPGATPSAHPTSSPVGFESSGDLQAAFQALKGSPVAILPYLSAALGRVGLTGARAGTAMAVHATAMQLTQALGLEMDHDVLYGSNQWVRVAAQKAALAVDATGSGPGPTSPTLKLPGAVHTEGLVITGPVQCPGARARWAPCPPPNISPTTGPFSGCCFPPSPIPVPRDYHNSPECHYGVGREPLNAMSDDPCHDDCLGMCGPGCSPWDWVCGDESVHTACWRHDSVSSCDWWNVVCWAAYGSYSAWIFTDTEALGMCENTIVTDAVTDPGLWGLWANHPGYYDYDPSN